MSFNPVILVFLMFCVAPLLIFAAGVAVGRLGTPVSVHWNWRRGAGPVHVPDEE